MADRPRRRVLRWIAGVVALVIIVGGAFWAGRVTLRSPESAPTDSGDSVLVAVTQQTVGKTYRYNVTVTRDEVPVAVNALAGVVTQVSQSGVFNTGDVVYAVGGVPVRVVAGTTPFYRDLGSGDKGADVAQLNAALHALGYLNGEDSVFDWSTAQAVKNWQKDLGMSQTGVVANGELLAVTSLPAELTIDDSVRKASVLQGGEQVVFEAAGDPRFELELGSTEAAQIPMGANVAVTSGQVTWDAVVTGQQQQPSGMILFTLTAPDGSVVCGDQCDELPAGQATVYLLSQVSVVPPVTGPGVPVAAIVTQPDGSTIVYVDANGVRTSRAVTVLGSQNGIAVVDGVQVGEQVQVFGSSTASQPVSPSASVTPR